MLELQIITTSYCNEDILNMNYQYSLLDKVKYKWINIVNNKNRAELSNPNIFDINGIVKTADMDGSTHHGLAVNKALTVLEKSSYLLVLDMDFFILKPIKEILSYMEEKQLDFYGATYPENTSRNLQREFPCGFCMFINCRTINTSLLDFTPTFHDTYNFKKDIYKDMSYKIYEQYKDISRYEAIKCHSVHRPEEYFIGDVLFGTHFRLKRHRKDNGRYQNSVKDIKNYIKGKIK